MENNYEYIANPVNGERFQTNSLEGRAILKNLIKSSLNGDNSIQIGGLKEEHLGKFLNTLLTEDLSHKKVFLEYLKMIWKNDDDIKLKDFIDHLNKWFKENEEPNDKNDQLNKNLKKLNYELLNPFSPEIIKFNYNTDTKKFQPLADSSSEYFTLLESEGGLIYDLLKDNQNLIDKRIFYYKITASENIIADTIYLLTTINDRPYPFYIKINKAKNEGETFYAQSEGYRENDKFWLVEADNLTDEQKKAAFELTKYIDENALGKALKNLKECLLNIIESNKSIAENISFEIELTNDKQYNFFIDADNYDNYDIEKIRWEEQKKIESESKQGELQD